MSNTTPASLEDLKFRSNADSGLRKAAAAGDARAFQKALNALLAKARKRFEKEFSATPFVAMWSGGKATAAIDCQLCELIASQGNKPTRKSKQLEADVAAVATFVVKQLSTSDQVVPPLVSLTAAELLLRYGKSISAEDTVTIFLALAAVGSGVAATTVQSDTEWDGSKILSCGEIPFVLGNLLGQLQSFRKLTNSGSVAVAEAIEACTDTDGTLNAAWARSADDWAAPIVRVAAWAMAFETKWGVRKTLNRWDNTIERLASLLTPDGLITQFDNAAALSQNVVDQQLEIIRHAARLAEFDSDSDVAALLRKPGKSDKKKKSKAQEKQKRHSFSEQSDWAESAILRSGTTIDADVIGLNWDQDLPELCLAALGTKVLGGAWDCQVTVDGKPHKPVGQWVCTCWFQDKEVAFAELEAGADDGIRHVRHVMLSLIGHFAVITDSVTSADENAEIECTTTVPLTDGVSAENNSITRELLLNTECYAVRAVPAWLDDDRVQQALGEFKVNDGALRMTATNRGGVTMPLVLDWHPERIAGEADWNGLTVTEERQVLVPWQAAGYRVRIANLQLLLYRSLRPGETLRAVLGLHTARETVYGRFRKDGELSPLVLVESEA